MIDPISIGIAFTAAQQSVGYIKKAMALGKDVNSLYKQFGAFFENSDKVHSASVNLQLQSDKLLTDGEIRSQALQIAMQSKALRDAEKQLKDLLIWTGNRDVWDEMISERVRLLKERNAKIKAVEEARAKARMELVDRALIFLSFSAIAIPAFAISLTMITR